MDHVSPWRQGRFLIRWTYARRLTDVLGSVGPALLFGLRFWAAVSLAFYVAFWLEFDNAQRAATSAAVVCQPSLGASLRKGWFRLIGTIVGAVMIVVLTAFFVQSRIGFLLGIALWGALCSLLATTLRNFAAYSAALAGYTAIIIASDELGAVGGANGQVFLLAVTRASEICIGIVCAGVVLAATDLGGARRRLAVQLAALVAEISDRVVKTLALNGPVWSQARPVRRDLIRRVIALDPIFDEVIGESSELRYHSSRLQAATSGLFAALACWRTTAAHLERLPAINRRREADLIKRHLPPKLMSIPIGDDSGRWAADFLGVHRACVGGVRALASLPAQTPSLQLLADQAAGALIGIERAVVGLILLVNPARAIGRSRIMWPTVPDIVPPLINALRTLLSG
jgi:hypothetical protein